jgi:hypothetical protein
VTVDRLAEQICQRERVFLPRRESLTWSLEDEISQDESLVQFADHNEAAVGADS